jgi:hypothetical protein
LIVATEVAEVLLIVVLVARYRYIRDLDVLVVVAVLKLIVVVDSCLQ